MYGIEVYLANFGSQEWSGLYCAVDQTERFPRCAGETSTLSVSNRERAALKTLCLKLFISLTKNCHIKKRRKNPTWVFMNCFLDLFP